MAGSLSNYLDGRIVEQVLRGVTVASPVTVYLALFTSDPTADSVSGVEASTATMAGYTRQPITWSALNASNQTSNTNVVTFPANGNASASIIITHVVVFDALTGGNRLARGPLANPKTLAPGDVFSLQVGAQTITLTGAFSHYLKGKIVDHYFRNIAFAPPAANYMALFETDPTENTAGTEATYTGYARQAATWSSIDANNVTKNSNVITFPANGNASLSETLAFAAIFDAVTLGNKLFFGPLTASKSIDPGDVLAIPVNAHSMTLT